MNAGRTTQECIDRIEQKIDRIIQDITAIHEALAQNEAEHSNYERRLVELAEKKHAGVEALAWVSSIVAIMLTVLTLLQKL